MNTQHISAERKIQLAATGILLDHPFFGDLLAFLRKKSSRDTQTFKVDGETIFYNPDFVDTLSIPETKGVLAHETLHVALTHHLRRKHRDPQLWNQAGDYVVNSILDGAGFTLPDDALRNPSFNGMSAEEVYRILEEMSQNNDGNSDRDGDNQQQQGQGGDGQGGGGQSQGGQGDGQGGSGQSQDGEGDGEGNQPPPLSTGDFTDGTSSEEERTKQEADWHVRATQAAQAARSQGKLPGQLQELVDEIIKPKVSWKSTLRDFVSTIAQDGYTMMPPNRRLRALGINLPSRRSQSLGHVVIGVDTSGSVSSEELKQFQAEINSVLEEHPEAKATVIQCDWDIQDIQEYESADLPIKMSYKGRGGTRFSPVFEAVDEMNDRPDCLVYLTDLGSSFPDQPEYPTLWVSVVDGEAPWGTTTVIN